MSERYTCNASSRLPIRYCSLASSLSIKQSSTAVDASCTDRRRRRRRRQQSLRASSLSPSLARASCHLDSHTLSLHRFAWFQHYQHAAAFRGSLLVVLGCCCTETSQRRNDDETTRNRQSDKAVNRKSGTALFFRGMISRLFVVSCATSISRSLDLVASLLLDRSITRSFDLCFSPT